ncbi:MAG: hypothetical protein ABSB78_09480 [Bacteroidota bacterium]
MQCVDVEDFWEKAKKENTPEAYIKFIKEHSAGRFTAEAMSTLEKLYFHQAKELNIIPAYRHFLKMYPESIYADSVKTILNNFETIDLIIRKSGDLKKSNVEYRLIGNAKGVFELAGIIINEDGVEHNKRIIVDISGDAQGGNYTTLGQGFYQYAGAEIYGSVVFLIGSAVKYKKSFRGLKEPPSEIQFANYNSPSNAPFASALDKSNCARYLYEILAVGWGIEAVQKALDNISKHYYIWKPKIESKNIAQVSIYSEAWSTHEALKPIAISVLDSLNSHKKKK